LWEELSYWQLLGIYNSHQIAEKAVDGKEYDYGIHNGPGDAVRHCVWNCEMARRNSKQCAKKWGDAHEPKSCKNKKEQEEKDMDQHNNAVGRDLAQEEEICIISDPEAPIVIKVRETCETLCKKALKDGKLKVLEKERWGTRQRP
jgi:hypothetical protein